MDPRIAFVVVALMMLLNGGVLGLVHRSFPREIRPSAVDWRIGTLLMAGSALLYGVQNELPPGFILPVANGCAFVGFGLYARALRRFEGCPDTLWLFVPAMLGIAGIFWFSSVQPRLDGRVLVSTLVWISIIADAIRTLRWRAKEGSTISRSVLSSIFIGLGIFLVVRCLYVLLQTLSPATRTGMPIATTADAGNWLNLVSPMVMAVLPIIGTTAFLLMCSERIRRSWELAAATDYLTGLANRRTTTLRGTACFDAARRTHGSLALALIDIDHFKRINDAYGHDIGDQALRHVAQLLEQHCRGNNMVGRQGGEEFVALLDGADAAAAAVAAERLRAAIEEMPMVMPAAVSGNAIAMTVSIGVSILDPGDHALEDLLRRADQALYAAKAGGRNRVELSGVVAPADPFARLVAAAA